jgi:hypothetical protein
MLAKILIATSAAIIVALGLVHLTYTFFTRKFNPRDQALELHLKTAALVITRQTSMWNAWIGFNASHSLGAILFGGIYGYLALQHEAFLIQSHFLALFGLGFLLSYLVLAKLYWFSVPFRGIALACACYVAGFFIALL